MHISVKRVTRGFTLIELLVVISIIALLAAILFPVFARARENARRSSCLSNLKQVSLGMKMYVQDYDETLPPYFTNGTAPGTGYDGQIKAIPEENDIPWPTLLQPYMKSMQLFQCPSEPTLPGSMDVGSYSGGLTDYWANSAAVPSTWASTKTKPVKISQFTYPSMTVLLGDGASHQPNYNITGTGTGGKKGDLAYIPDNGNRHLGGANMAFADGHVKWFKGNPDAPAGKPNTSSVYNGLTPSSASVMSFMIN